MNLLETATKYIDKYSHNLIRDEQGHGWSHICGGVDGQEFLFGQPGYELVGVKGRYSTCIHGLQFLFYDIQNKRFVESAPYGFITGDRFELLCDKGERIVRVYIWSGQFIDAIQFETNTGRKSAVFGGNQGHIHVIDAFKGRFCSVKGRSSQIINQLCFCTAP